MVNPPDYSPWEPEDMTPPPTFRAVSLSALMMEGVPEPEFLPGTNRMLYKGGVHGIAGPPDCGKTTIALDWAVGVMREGGVVAFLDEEGGPEVSTEKLAALGADVEMLERLLYLPFPSKSWTENDSLDLQAMLRDAGATLLLIDSAAAILARAGLDENSASDCTKFWSRVLTPIAKEIGCSVLIIDHDTKATEGSRYARGSGAKLAATEVQFKVERIKAFTKQQDGILKFLVTKDRRGSLNLHWRILAKTGDKRVHFEWQQEVATDDGDSMGEKWSPARQAIYKALDGEYRTRNQVVDRMVANGDYPLRRETFSREVVPLVRDSYVDEMDTGAGREKLWRRVPEEPLDQGSVTGLTCDDHGSVTGTRDQDPDWETLPGWQ